MKLKLLTISLLLLSCPAAAYLQIAQGDRVYMNETVDISQAISWPNFQIVWCAANNYDCDPPDQIIDIESKMQAYWIDPSVFRYGTYYRWDGKWHSAENAIAFNLIPGRRPVNKTIINKTAEMPGEIVRPNGPFHYLIARGDTPTISTFLNRSDSCHLWVFSNTVGSYDIPLGYNNGTYSYTFGESDTMAMSTGEYAGYIQCNGNNQWQDIYYDSDYFKTPYRVVKDVPVPVWNLLNAKRQFDDLIKDIPRFDDVLIPMTISVVDPTTTITGVEQDDKKLYISGTTTWGENTTIQLKLDPENYKLAQDIRFHTWDTYAIGSIDAPRTFATAMSLNKEELYVGQHEITMNVQKNRNTAISSYQFHISDIYVMPTPTPVIKRMVLGKDWNEIPEKTIIPTVTPTIEPEPTWEEFVVITPTPNATANITTVPTATPTVNQTTIPVAKETIPVIPINPIVALAAIVSAIVIRGKL
jgi:hypothetical protein